MAKELNANILPANTILDIVKISGNGKIVVKEMTLSEWNNFVKNPSFRYIAYQKGFHQFKI